MAMQIKKYDVIVVGCGAAGMAAVVELRARGVSTAVIEREAGPGGILLQCIHNGFGLHNFKEELTGPEYAERFVDKLVASGADIFCNSTVMSIDDFSGKKRVLVHSSEHGSAIFEADAVVLAMGCRERTRGNIGIAGGRPAGVYTAGLAQRLVNMEGLLPGKRVVIVGSGDIGLIMARRMSWSGAKVLAVVEIQPYPSGLTRNLVQCLDDFKIPLYLSHCVSRIDGKDRVERVEIKPLVDGVPSARGGFELECDTVLLSVGLIPENEISQKVGVEISPDTKGPYVNGELMTNVEGIFACGNVLHVHDVVDFVSEEARYCGQRVADYLGNKKVNVQCPVIAGKNVRYVVPNSCDPASDNVISLRSTVVDKNVRCMVRSFDKVIACEKLRHIAPAEMIRINLTAGQMAAADGKIEISLESDDG